MKSKKKLKKKKSLETCLVGVVPCLSYEVIHMFNVLIWGDFKFGLTLVKLIFKWRSYRL